MKIIGIDLAGNPKNDTGFCIMEIEGDKKKVYTKILHSNYDIIKNITEIKPKIIAVDAPLTYLGDNRKCDMELRDYGALPVTLKGMEVLAVRGTELAGELGALHLNLIEVFSKASAKILGFYNKREKVMQKSLINAGISGSVDERFLSRDELDAIFAAITGYLYINGLTATVGDDTGKIIIPRV